MGEDLSRVELSGRWARLPRSVFRLSGPDRVRYLDGQVTQNVGGIAVGESKPGCLCSLKGKVEFLIWITSFDDFLLIDGQADQREELEARLDRYLIADDCELEDVTNSWELVHHFAPEIGGIPSKRLAKPGWDQWNAKESFSNNQNMSADEWALASLLAGIPESPFEITGNEFPAELGLDQWAVDFHKGCYLGQEVISRIESVGKVKRSIRIVLAETPLNQNAEVRNSAGQRGRVIRAISSPNEKKFLGTAWFKTGETNSQLHEIERVATD